VYQSVAARIASGSADTFSAFSQAKHIQPVHDLVFLDTNPNQCIHEIHGIQVQHRTIHSCAVEQTVERNAMEARSI
jgi:hypothetical protein